MSDRRLFPLMLLLAGIAALTMGLLSGCGDDDSPRGTAKLTGSCESCHRDAEILQATATPEPPKPPSDSGET